MGIHKKLAHHEHERAAAKRARTLRRKTARAKARARARGQRIPTWTTVPLTDVPICALLHDRKLVAKGRRTRPRFRVVAPSTASPHDFDDLLGDLPALVGFEHPAGASQWMVEVEHDDQKPWQSALPARFQPVPDDWRFDLDTALANLLPDLQARARAKALKVGAHGAFVRDDLRAELVQVAVVAVLEAVDKCRDLRAFHSYALTVAERAMNRHFRHQRRWKRARSGQWNRDHTHEVMEGERHFAYMDFDSTVEELATVDHELVDPLDQLLDTEERDTREHLTSLVLQAVAAHRHGDLALAHFIDGTTYDNLAAEYAITPANARQRVSRCIQDMRDTPELQEAMRLL